MPADLDQLLRAAAPRPTRALDVDATIVNGLRARRRRTVLRAVGGGITGAAAIVGVVVAMSVVGRPMVDIDGSDLTPVGPAEGEQGDGSTLDGREGPNEPHDAWLEPDAGDDGELRDDAPFVGEPSVAERLAEFDADVDVAAAVAPYNNATAIEEVLLGSLLRLPMHVAASRCIEGLGVTDEWPPSLPDRATVATSFRLYFPDLDHLLQGGLAIETSEDVEWSSAYEQADRICRDRERPDARQVAADELYRTVLTAWHQVLDEVDRTPEVRDAGDRFTACLVAEGIPAEQAANEVTFLGHLDGVTMRHDGPLEELDDVYAERGRLYAVCARELFEARERLRFDRRPAFLAEHQDAIAELEAWLEATYGPAGS